MKKTIPAITLTEIICYAIRFLQKEIDDMVAYCDGIPEKDDFLKLFVSQRSPKLDALKIIYRMETGTDYE